MYVCMQRPLDMQYFDHIYSFLSQFLVSELILDDYLEVNGIYIKNVLPFTILLAASAKLVSEISNRAVCDLFSCCSLVLLSIARQGSFQICQKSMLQHLWLVLIPCCHFPLSSIVCFSDVFDHFRASSI